MSTPDQPGLTVVRSFAYLHEADIAKTLLESYGIEALILNEHQIRQLAGATGRVRLAVAPENVYRARQVLEDDHSAALEDADAEE